MKRTGKILISFVALCITITAMVYGVLAALQASLSVTSSLSFSAYDVVVKITEVNVYQGVIGQDNEQNPVLNRKAGEPLVSNNTIHSSFDIASAPVSELVWEIKDGEGNFIPLEFTAEYRYLIFEIKYANYSENGVKASLRTNPEIIELPNGVYVVPSSGENLGAIQYEGSTAVVATTEKLTAHAPQVGQCTNDSIVVLLYLTNLATNISTALTESNLNLSILFEKYDGEIPTP